MEPTVPPDHRRRPNFVRYDRASDQFQPATFGPDASQAGRRGRGDRERRGGGASTGAALVAEAHTHQRAPPAVSAAVVTNSAAGPTGRVQRCGHRGHQRGGDRCRVASPRPCAVAARRPGTAQPIAAAPAAPTDRLAARLEQADDHDHHRHAHQRRTEMTTAMLAAPPRPAARNGPRRSTWLAGPRWRGTRSARRRPSSAAPITQSDDADVGEEAREQRVVCADRDVERSDDERSRHDRSVPQQLQPAEERRVLLGGQMRTDGRSGAAHAVPAGPAARRRW